MPAVTADIEESDYLRWKKENRADIIHILKNEAPVWAGDHLISAKTGRTVYGCPFLMWENDRHSCSIYETRPGVCRAFIPASSEICPLYGKIR